MSSLIGTVYFVGAGPGAPDLISVRGARLLARAETVVHDRLIDRALLENLREDAEIIDVGKVPGDHKVSQEQINRILVDRAKQGKTVVRLKGGDPFVFGRGYEEAHWCFEHGVPCVVVPGVTSAIAGPTAAGIPITQRKLVRSIAVVTATAATECESPDLDFRALSVIDTLIIMMGRAALRAFASQLIGAGRSPQTPVACIRNATMSSQQIITATLGEIADVVDQAGLASPIVTIVGQVAALAERDRRCVAGPLMGMRIAITGPASAHALADALGALGAVVIRCPMLYFENTPNSDAIAQKMVNLRRYDWIVLTSAQGILALSAHWRANGCDVRALGDCKVAVVGPGTARGLERLGLRADLVAEPHSARGLAATLERACELSGSRILYPRSDVAKPTLVDLLRAKGARVDEYVAYRNKEAAVSEAVLGQLRDGVDLVVFMSPSAAERFARLDLDLATKPLIASIGPSTAEGLRSLGFSVDITPERHTADGLVQAIVAHVWSTVSDA
ncbi:MAG: uroporphyrinogen-III C-methyltransferase [Phycisphaerae bacterium]